MRSILCKILVVMGMISCNNRSYDDWTVYGGSAEAIKYSSLAQIDSTNVTDLKIAWEYHTGDADTAKFSQIQCNPIIVHGTLYATTPKLQLIALDAKTGKLKWSFNPDSANRNKEFYHFILNNNRGVTYWEDKDDTRIFYTAGSSLYAVHAQTGKLIESFGNQGSVDLHEGLGRDVKDLYIAATSPGIIYKDLFILGSRVDEAPNAAPGHIRAFDVRTGKIKWIFHTIPQPGEYGFDSWEDPNAWKNIGGANSWSGFSLDKERGILFAPTGSASFDFYGGMRKGANLFANCLLALDAATGKRKWHFQFIHHDLWDYDIPAPPVLVNILHDGKKIDAVAQTTKHGMVYVFNRETGEPIFPINEIPVDTTTHIPGEKVWPTQPIPTLPKPFVRQVFTEADINPFLADSSKAAISKQLTTYRYGKMFIPPGTQTAVQFPGLDGGAEWGGPSFDPETGFLYMNANEMPWLMTLMPTTKRTEQKETVAAAGLRLYTQYCVSCHGTDRKGTGNNPSILNVGKTYTSDGLDTLIRTGRRMMPAFTQLHEQERKAIIAYILSLQKEKNKIYSGPKQPIDSFRNLPWTITGYYKFMKDGYPAIRPPWGSLTAINLNNGEQVWQTALGEYPELTSKGIPATGTENYGGSVVTAGGLVFIAATKDKMIRAFHKRTGKLLWEHALPAPGFATPSIYAVNGKQFLVIACGGGKLGTKSGDSYVAFSLPD